MAEKMVSEADEMLGKQEQDGQTPEEQTPEERMNDGQAGASEGGAEAAETAEDTGSEASAEADAENSEEESVEDSAEESAEDSAEESAEDSAEESAEDSAKESAGDSAEETAGESAEEQSGASDGEADDSAGGKKSSGSKKGFFKKKDKKDPKDEKIEELTDRLQRQMAEFDNFRKRTEKEKASMYQIGAKDVIEKLLPVVDNFERGLETGDQSDPFVDGMNKIYKQMTTLLADLGVTPIEAEGQPFDPNLHNAVMHIDDESLGENVVVEEFQKGYMYKDTVVRFSMVKVAN